MCLSVRLYLHLLVEKHLWRTVVEKKLIKNGYLSLPHHVPPGQGVSLHHSLTIKIIQASKNTQPPRLTYSVQHEMAPC